MKKSWMSQLATFYNRMRNIYPNDRLIILFDIDGTILDMRYMVYYALKSYDNYHHTNYYKNLQLRSILIHENQVDEFLVTSDISLEKQKEILDWYNDTRWTSEFILQSHKPFSGVLEVIRWFQLQPYTYIGLNTGRPEELREDTLRSLNELGKEYRVQFTSELLHMNLKGWNHDVETAKVQGIKYFQNLGYRIFAFVDNEPKNLKAVSQIDKDKEILLLHANTIFRSPKMRLPSPSVKGNKYDLTELIFEKDLPRHIQFVWHGINDEVNLKQFLISDITWGECDVRLDPLGHQLILRHDSFKDIPMQLHEDWLGLDGLLKRIKNGLKSAKLDLKSGGSLIDKIINLLRTYGFQESELWFNGNVERLQEEGFIKLKKVYPKAILQCPIDFLAPLIITSPLKAKEILDMFVSWGINRFSINWFTEGVRPIIDQLHSWDYDINIYNVPDLESFLQAVLLLPRSITSDFNFPKWYYFGRGSGENGQFYEYSVRKSYSKK